MDWKQRSTEEEWMDAPDVPLERLKEVFIDINRANIWLGGNQVTVKAIEKIVKKGGKKSYTILDVGCGDGHMLREVVLNLRKRGVSAQLTGVELRADIVEIAKEKCSDFPEISIKQGNLFTANTDELRSDFVLCTLTLHHFQEKELKQAIDQLLAMTQDTLIVNDLQRSRLAFFLFRIFGFFFMRTAMARNDGAVSIKRGFLKKELESYSKKIPNVISLIEWKWAFRYLWTLRPQ